jgi:osmotically-inducible protein OsmY
MTKTTDIRQAVEAELKFDPLVNDADVHVLNVNGDVALNGTVPSYPQYLEASAAAQRVSGVKDVHNHLQVVLPDSDFRDDATLTTAANNALKQNITVPDGVEATADVKVATDGSVITLTGHVRTWAEHDAVVDAAGMARGVIDIDDELQITG